MLKACKEQGPQVILAFVGGILAAEIIARIRTRYLTKETKEKQEPDCIKTVSFGEGVGRLIKQGSFWLSGSSRSDLSGGPQTPDLNEQQQHITFYEAPELPAVLIKDSSGIPPYPKSAFDEGYQSPIQGKTPSFEDIESPFGGLSPASPQFLLSPPKLQVARALSGIPTDINVPELVFGKQEDEILPFQIYAPCRILDLSPGGKENSHLFEALKTIASSYLRADNSAIADSIQKYSLNDLLYGIARLEVSLREIQQGQEANDVKTFLPGKKNLSRRALQQAAEALINDSEELGPKDFQEIEAVKAVVASFMHEMECILHEYLSFHWDRTDDIFDANRDASVGGLFARASMLTSVPSMASDMASIGGISPVSLSRHQSGWTDFGSKEPQPLSPSSVTDSVHSQLETFDEYLANLPHSQSYPSPRFLGSFEGIGSERNQNGTVNKGENNGPEIGSPLNSSDNEALLEPEPRTRLSHEEYFGRQPKRRMSLAVSDPALSSKAHQSNHRTVRKLRIPDSGDELVDGTERNSLEVHQKAQKARRRALREWKRKREAANRDVTKDMLGHNKRFLSLTQMFRDLEHSVPSVSTRRQPVVLLLGGGMAAGKSTVREIIGQDGFWSKVGKDAVVVEADAIKNSDQLFASMSRANLVDMLDADNELKQHLHEYSTKAAEILLVAALNQQKDVVFDGTMTWAPFVRDTILMVRDHKHNYKRGPGFVVNDAGVGSEMYWEIDEDCPIDTSKKIPYRVEFVGVTCDPGLAVARGIWRKIRTGRSVPVEAQLRSHRLFSENFEEFTRLVDCSTLYDTGCALTTFNKGGIDLTPQLIAHKSSYTRGELLINPSAYNSFKHKRNINDQANCRADLYAIGNGQVSASIPTTLEDEDSALRHVFRAADNKQRRERNGKQMHSFDVKAT